MVSAGQVWLGEVEVSQVAPVPGPRLPAVGVPPAPPPSTGVLSRSATLTSSRARAAVPDHHAGPVFAVAGCHLGHPVAVLPDPG